MCQNEVMFINILNRFRRTIHTIEDINNLCLKEPPKGSTIIFLFYTNKEVMTYNDQIFLNVLGPKFCFEAIDI
jgi:hypothetical protein